MLDVRSVFVSDAHLGTPDCRADYLLDFLRATRAEHLYLVGDIVDLEALALRPYWPDEHAAVVAEIVAIAARGTRVTYIPGNHDAPLRGLHGATVAGVEIRLRAEHVGADGRRWRVTHGDECDHEQGGRRWLGWIGHHGHRGLRWVNRSVNRARRALGLPYYPLAIATKTRLAIAMDFIDRFERRIADAARAAGFDGQICGHIHYGNIRPIGDVEYLNDGDWVEHCTALVEHHDGTMELLHWSESRAPLVASPARVALAHVA